MSNIIETQAVVVRESSAVGQALGVNEILAQVRLIQDVMGKVMQEDQHFGIIPGTGSKKTLLQPGAQKLCMTFRLAPEYELQETNLPRDHKEYRVICTLKSIQTGNFVGQGVGCCSTMESKYRYRNGSRKCPLCGAEAIIKGKKEYGGGWLCFAKKGGCGAKWDDHEEAAKAIEAQGAEKVECDNPADFYNTVLKMAKKRAFVDATITATAASDIFTQDVGDDEPNGDAPPTPRVPVSSPPKPQTAPTRAEAPKTPPAASWTKRTPNEQKLHMERLTQFLTLCRTELINKLGPVMPSALEYAAKTGIILQGESLEDASLGKLFPGVDWDRGVEENKLPVKRGFESITAAIQSFMDGNALPDEPKAVLPTQKIKDPLDGPDDEWFMNVIVPIPHKGQKRDEYMKAPDTIKSLYEQRHGTDEDAQLARERLYGFVNHYQPKGWTKKDGTQMPPSESDKKFREALDAFSDWQEKTGEKL